MGSLLQRLLLSAAAALALASCATLPDPLQVTVTGLEPLPAEGLELRLLLKLRVQNPNDTPIEYSGAAVTLEVDGNTFATGVSDTAGTVPRFGEAIVPVPVTISMLRAVRQAVGMAGRQPSDSIRYEMSGKLARRGPGSVRFWSKGELRLPGEE